MDEDVAIESMEDETLPSFDDAATRRRVRATYSMMGASIVMTGCGAGVQFGVGVGMIVGGVATGLWALVMGAS